MHMVASPLYNRDTFNHAQIVPDRQTKGLRVRRTELLVLWHPDPIPGEQLALGLSLVTVRDLLLRFHAGLS